MQLKPERFRYRNMYKRLMKEGCARAQALSVVCACAKVTLGDVAQKDGSGSEGYIKLVLAGFMPVREPLRQAYQKLLGFDPWCDELGPLETES
jgi:hypothetical protein